MITPQSSKYSYLETLATAEVDGANAEAELAARKRAAKVRRGAMINLSLERGSGCALTALMLVRVVVAFVT